MFERKFKAPCIKALSAAKDTAKSYVHRNVSKTGVDHLNSSTSIARAYQFVPVLKLVLNAMII